MIDNIQSIFDSNKLGIDEFTNIASKKDVDRFKRKIIEIKDELPKRSFLLFLANNYLSTTKITGKDIMLFLIMLEYFKLSQKTKDLELFNEIISVAHKQAENECKTVKKQDTKIRNVGFLLISLMLIPNHMGWIWDDYVANEISYNSNQLLRQYMIDLEQQNDTNLDNDVYKNIFDKQQRTHLNINDNKVSGAIETHVDFLVNKTFLEVGNDYKMEKCKFIGVNDDKQTEMCHSLDGKIFYLNDWNEYDRYSAIDKKIVRYRTFGMILGENLPPITNHIHWCRSNITYLI